MKLMSNTPTESIGRVTFHQKKNHTRALQYADGLVVSIGNIDIIAKHSKTCGGNPRAQFSVFKGEEYLYGSTHLLKAMGKAIYYL